MKIQWTYLFITCFVCFSLTSVVDARLLESDGGEEHMIVISKTGDVVCSFNIPKQYLNQEGNSILPINVSIYQSGKKAIYAESSFDLKPVLLPEIIGNYTVTITVGDYQAAYIYER